MLILKNLHGKNAWNRWLSFLATIVLSIAFLKDVWSEGSLDIWAYLTYPVGMMFCYAPVMAAKIIASLVKLIDAIARMKQSGGSVETTTTTTPTGDTKTSTTATTDSIIGGE